MNLPHRNTQISKKNLWGQKVRDKLVVSQNGDLFGDLFIQSILNEIVFGT